MEHQVIPSPRQQTTTTDHEKQEELNDDDDDFDDISMEDIIETWFFLVITNLLFGKAAHCHDFSFCFHLCSEDNTKISFRFCQEFLAQCG